jgi:hypothetical protein
MSEPSSVAKIRERLGVEAPAEPHWTEKVDLASRLQNRSITAQVCVKAAAKVVAAFDGPKGEPDWSAIEQRVASLTGKLLKIADSYIHERAARARKPKKEVAK